MFNTKNGIPPSYSENKIYAEEASRNSIFLEINSRLTDACYNQSNLVEKLETILLRFDNQLSDENKSEDSGKSPEGLIYRISSGVERIMYNNNRMERILNKLNEII